MKRKFSELKGEMDQTRLARALSKSKEMEVEIGRLKLYDYTNGNCQVVLYNDGSKIRSWPENKSPKPDFPDSLDLKCTDYCDRNCIFCHESSTKRGKHSSVEVILRAIEGLPKGVEIAIGGGNPLDHPYLDTILLELTKRSLVPNLTVHGSHALEHYGRLKNFQRAGVLYGIGISDPGLYGIMLASEPKMIPENCVCHTIVGVDDPFEIMGLRSEGANVLILGYKTFGRGVKFFNNKVTANISRWKYFIGDILRQSKGILSFDNLALSQLDIKNLVSEEVWSKHYMGDDGSFTMYFDAVSNQYAVSSTSPRIDADAMNIQQMFQSLQK